jgi:hydrogenase maturation protease
MKPVLMLGIGNTLRRDDAAGRLLAERLAGHPFIETHAVHQLYPEHIELFHDRRLVIFADAAIDCRELTCLSLSDRREPLASSIGHHQSPQGILGLYQALYGRWPAAEILKMPAADFGYGEGLSSTALSGLEHAVQLLQNRFSDSSSLLC